MLAHPVNRAVAELRRRVGEQQTPAAYCGRMSLNHRNYTKAVYGFDHVMRGVNDSTWGNASPCEGWTARDVVLHAAGVLRYVESLARGAAVVPPGDEPRSAWAGARDAVLEALDQPGALERVVPSPFGEMPLDVLVGILVTDTLTHSWDLARAVGGDERLAPELVTAVFEQVRPLDDGLRAPGRFDAKIPAAAGDDEQTSLLKFLGRRV